MDPFDATFAAWEAFFSAQLSAGATLLGLVFVGLSLNLTRILADPLLPVRAEVALIVLVLQLVAASIALVRTSPAAPRPSKSSPSAGWRGSRPRR